MQVHAVLEVGEGVHKMMVNPEEFHYEKEMKAGESLSSGSRLLDKPAEDVDGPGSPWVPTSSERFRRGPAWEAGSSRTSERVHWLGRLAEHKNKGGEISSALAWGDLTGMSLDAGKVKEARSKEIQYIRDKGVYWKIPRSQAAEKGW